jgi:hypothetical protein
VSVRRSIICLGLAFAAAPAIAQPAGGPVTRNDLIGRWAERGDCSDWMTYYANGIWRRADGGSGRWVLDGDTVTASVDGGNGASTATVRKLPDGSIARTAAFDGHTDHLTRCPAPAPRRR